MSLLTRVAGGLRALLRKRAVERELADEIDHYLELTAREHVRAGMTPAAAMRAARLEMGGVEAVKERVRDGGWEAGVESLGRDLRYAARALRRNPTFTL